MNKVLITDNFQSKTAEAAIIGLRNGGYERLINSPGKDIFEITTHSEETKQIKLLDSLRIKGYEAVSNSGIVDPQNTPIDQGDTSTWTIYSSSLLNKTVNAGPISYDDLIPADSTLSVSQKESLNYLKNLERKVYLISQSESLNTSRVIHIDYEPSTEKENLLLTKKKGRLFFRVAFPPLMIKRQTTQYFSSRCAALTQNDIDYFKSNPIQTTYFGFGAWGDTDNLRYNLKFVIEYADGSFKIKATDGIDSSTYDYILDEQGRTWDGKSLKTFMFTYNPDSSSEHKVSGDLYVLPQSREYNVEIDGKVNLEYLKSLSTNTWIKINTNRKYYPHSGADNPKQLQFGLFRANSTGIMGLNFFYFDIYQHEAKAVVYSNNSTTFYDDLYDIYNPIINSDFSFNIGGNGILSTNWCGDLQSEDYFLDIPSVVIAPTTDQFTSTNQKVYDALTKKGKTFVFEADEDAITSLNLSNKNITSINIANLKGLESLDLSDNKLETLDLSKCTSLSSINLSGNNNLSVLRLPNFGSLWRNDISINLTDTAIEEIILSDSASSAKKLSLTLSPENIKKISIRGVDFKTSGGVNAKSIFANYVFSNLESADISESGLLTNLSILKTFLGNLPDRTGKEIGHLFMYGKKYTSGNIQGSTDAIATELTSLKNKNWIFYL